MENEGVELIHFVADDLQPGHIITGRFGLYLQSTLRPSQLDVTMSVTSYTAPIESDGRPLATVHSELFYVVP